MRILAIDTSCGAASVAIVESGEPSLSRPSAGRWRADIPRRWPRWSRRRCARSRAGSLRSIASRSRSGPARSPASGSASRWRGRWAWRSAFRSSAFRRWRRWPPRLLSDAEAGVIAAAIDARHGSVYFQLFESSGRPLGPRGATRCANACAESATGRHCWPETRRSLVAAEAHRAGLPYDLSAARTAPDIVAVARMGLALDPAGNPARPLYVKPPDARPNPSEPIARVPA